MYPKRFIKLPLRTKPIQAIVIHSTNCRCPFPSLKVDDKTFQVGDILVSNIALDKELDCIFHYILDTIGDDVYVIVGRPIHYMYNGFALNNTIYDNGLHICLVGNYDLNKPSMRQYEVLAYRVVAPLLYQFRIPFNNVVTHSMIDNNVNCPGKLFDMNVFMTILKKYRQS